MFAGYNNMIKGCTPRWAAGINQNTEYHCDDVSAITNLGACPGDDDDYDYKWSEEGKRLMEDERRTSVNEAVEVYGRIQLAVRHII